MYRFRGNATVWTLAAVGEISLMIGTGPFSLDSLDTIGHRGTADSRDAGSARKAKVHPQR